MPNIDIANPGDSANALSVALKALVEYNINDLLDVSAAGATNAYVLTYISANTTWIAAAVPGSTLDSLTDVVTTGAANAYVLTYSAANSTWIAGTPSASTLDGLSDVSTAGAANAYFLMYVSANTTWVATALPSSSLDGLSDVVTTGASNGQFLMYLSANTTWVPATVPGSTLDGLTDVSTAGVSNAQVLMYISSNTTWVPATIAASTLDGLSDVVTTGVSNGQVLIYNAANTTWVPGAAPSSIEDLDDLGDVDVSGVGNGHVLIYNASNTTWTSMSTVGAFGISFYLDDTPTASTRILDYLPVQDFTLPSGLTGSSGWAQTAPSAANVAFDIQKNDVSVGTILFQTSLNEATFTFASNVGFTFEDRLAIIAPANLQSIAEMTITIKAFTDTLTPAEVSGTIGILTYTANHTIAATDMSKYQRYTIAANVNATVPNNATEAISIGKMTHLRQQGAGYITVVAGSGVTVNTPETLILRKSGSAASLIKVGTNEWDLSGDLQPL